MTRTRWLILLGVAATLIAFAAFGAACKSSKKSTLAPTATGAAATATEATGQTPQSTTGGTPQAGTTVSVRLAEYSVTPDVTSAPSGAITFNATNIGATDHQLTIIRTDLAEGALPAKADNSIDESGAGIQIIAKIDKFPASSSPQSTTVTLAPGNYVLVCNLVTQTAAGANVSHYHSGMHKAFTVSQ